MPHALILGSASPRRAELLLELGIPFTIRPSNVAEIPLADEEAAGFASRAAREKAMAVAQAHRGAWVLSADTVVVVDGQILGKPASTADAVRMLRRLSGRRHHVVTGAALVAPDGTVRGEITVDSTVEFRTLSEDEIERYVASGEPLDKAGAYGIQGGAARFVTRVVGSYSNVVGLPLDEVRELLRRHGVLK